jgi:hypothetical protein
MTGVADTIFFKKKIDRERCNAESRKSYTQKKNKHKLAAYNNISNWQ